ncbi:unnamed protein product [Cuscuta campestris]|uniref:CCHC-type domain-containing protein n=1 Tax=Cuscuta campestris TaxID=132261 RepID=A0A484MSZ5_9ASTE|nr:unnamed protein product [Cuscuta campestris]
MMEEEVVIVGAGIGGLAAAVALKRVGVKAVVLERAAELRATGSAIGLFPNAWRALDAIGVADKLQALYAPVGSALIIDVNTKVTQEVRYDANGKRAGPRVVHRKTLLQTLASELDSDTIRFSSRIRIIESQVEDGHHFAVLGLEDGTIIKAKVVIGCDGIHSVVARNLKLASPVESGRSAVRGLAIYPNGHGLPHAPHQELRHKANGTSTDVQPSGLFTSAGKGKKNGGKKKERKSSSKGAKPDDVCNYCKEKGHWKFDCPKKKKQSEKQPVSAAVAEEDTNSEEDIALVADENTHHSDDFPETFIDVVRHADVSATSWASLMFRYPWDVIFGKLNTENVTVLGDAMHPTTPDLGQGGGMALEDAVVLGRHIGNVTGPDGTLTPEGVSRALTNYVEEWRWRAAWVIAASFVSGWVQQDGSGWFMKFLRGVFYKTIMPKIFSIADYDCGKLPSKNESFH